VARFIQLSKGKDKTSSEVKPINMGSLPIDASSILYATNMKSNLSERAALTDQTNRQLNHSPVESPPAVKKKLCRLSQGSSQKSVHQGALDNLDAEFVFDAPAVEIAEIALGGIPKRLQEHNRVKEACKKRTILKKKDYHSAIPSLTQSRNVHFRDSVTVFRMDADGGYLCTECQSLQSEPEGLWSRRASLRRGSYRNLKNNSHPTSPTGDNDGAWTVSTSTYPPPTPHPDHVTSNPLSSAKLPSSQNDTSQINFTFLEDPSHGLKLKFQVPIGVGYGPNDIIVKANMSGNRIRVIANRLSPTGEPLEGQFNERYPLPMDVDPYRVTARLDTKGQLIVEAPVMTIDRKEQVVTSK